MLGVGGRIGRLRDLWFEVEVSGGLVSGACGACGVKRAAWDWGVYDD